MPNMSQNIRGHLSGHACRKTGNDNLYELCFFVVKEVDCVYVSQRSGLCGFGEKGSLV